MWHSTLNYIQYYDDFFDHKQKKKEEWGEEKKQETNTTYNIIDITYTATTTYKLELQVTTIIRTHVGN